MLTLFNNTNFLAGIFLFIYLLIIRMFGFIHPVPVPEHGGVLYLAIIKLLQGSPLVFAMVAALVTFINALLVNKILFDKRIGTHRDYFAALLYVLLSGSLVAFQTFTPYLAGSVFILLAINRLYSLSKESEKRETDYYVGLLIGLAGLMSPFYFIFIISGLLSMFLFGAFRLNEILAMLIGWINPFLLVGVYFYLIDGLPYFMNTTFTFHYAAYILFSKWSWGVYGMLLLFVGLFVAAVLVQPILMKKQQHHAKQFIRVIYNFLFAAFVSILFLDVSEKSIFFLLVLFLAMIFGVFYRRKNGEISWTMELVHFGFLLFVILNQYSFQLG